MEDLEKVNFFRESVEGEWRVRLSSIIENRPTSDQIEILVLFRL